MDVHKKKRISVLIATILLTVSALNANEHHSGIQKTWTLSDVQNAINHCETKVLGTLSKLSSVDMSPRTIPSGQKHWHMKPTGGWTSGFWAGILWYVYEGTGNEIVKSGAEDFTREIETILAKPVKSHDMGFIFNCSFGNGYRLTGNQKYLETLGIAADSLSTLFNPNVGTILSWPAQVRKGKFIPHNTIIDNMMNLELLFLAGKSFERKDLYKIAVTHADVTAKNHFRPNSTAFHVLVYDDQSGDCIQKTTHQGYSDESVWARGQAWAIYGYTMCYRETGKKKYKKLAEEVANAYLEHLSDDYIPFWDFSDPDIPNTVKDASSAAIVASAFLELSEMQERGEDKLFYRSKAERMLRELSSENYLSGGRNDAILLHSTGNKPKNGEVDIPIIYADYYYLEALIRLKNILEK